MKTVRIGRYNRTTKDTDILATITLADDGMVAIDGTDKVLVEDLRSGVTVPGEKTALVPEDGLPFLEALSVVFRNPQTFIAGPVIEGEQQPAA